MRLEAPRHADPRPPVRLRFDGREIEALPGETIRRRPAGGGRTSVASARPRLGGAARAVLAAWGVCFDCL